MPQMSPLLWLNLFMVFSVTFLVFMSINYFMKVPSKLSSQTTKISHNNMIWKW